jgi:hypothetical protein
VTDFCAILFLKIDPLVRLDRYISSSFLYFFIPSVSRRSSFYCPHQGGPIQMVPSVGQFQILIYIHTKPKNLPGITPFFKQLQQHQASKLDETPHLPFYFFSNTLLTHLSISFPFMTPFTTIGIGLLSLWPRLSPLDFKTCVDE